jgi:hypothetical protein
MQGGITGLRRDESQPRRSLLWGIIKIGCGRQVKWRLMRHNLKVDRGEREKEIISKRRGLCYSANASPDSFKCRNMKHASIDLVVGGGTMPTLDLCSFTFMILGTPEFFC